MTEPWEPWVRVTALETAVMMAIMVFLECLMGSPERRGFLAYMSTWAAGMPAVRSAFSMASNAAIL